jgi:hypothetical protein
MNISASLPYDDEEERVRHLNAIQQLAREAPRHGIDELIVPLLYEAELAELKATARIATFLPVLTIRRVRDVFRYVEDVHNGSDSPLAMEKLLSCVHSPALAGVLERLLSNAGQSSQAQGEVRTA